MLVRPDEDIWTCVKLQNLFHPSLLFPNLFRVSLSDPHELADGPEEEVLGKAYDSRLMKRLLQYLRPYKWQTTIALGSILLKVGADVLGPYLTKVVIDRYLAPVPGGHTLLDPSSAAERWSALLKSLPSVWGCSSSAFCSIICRFISCNGRGRW